MTGQLSGKTAVVTGSTSGIGRATALLFGQEGANVIVNGRREELGNEVATQIRQAGGSATYVRADVGVSDDLKDLVQSAVDTYGRLDILVNNAISFGPGPRPALPEEMLDGMYRTSLRAIVVASRFAIPEMRKVGGGSIINMSSIHGILAGFGMGAYNTVKAGMLNLTRNMAMDYGHQGIRVNAICPGFILTEKQEELLSNPDHPRHDHFRYKLLTTPIVYPLGRAGRTDEVAQACLFLASDASSFITGVTLPVDGGHTIQVQEELVDPLGRLFRRTFAKEWGIDLAEEDQGV